MSLSARSGFTLIELAIVLIIVGLVIGGVLTGRDLVRAAAVRGQITELQSYQAAVTTFDEKYSALPGDISARLATRFGFASRGTLRGQGDSNGRIEGNGGNHATTNSGLTLGPGETGLFWVDLSAAQLINSTFNTASITPFGATVTATTTPGLSAFFPNAKIGNQSFVYVWSGGSNATWDGTWFTNGDGVNYFGLSGISGIGNGAPAMISSITVRQAYDIDVKLDDGLPQSGRVKAQYPCYPGSVVGAAGNGGCYAGVFGAVGTAATPPRSSTCYDNNNTLNAVQRYSITYNGGAGVNCALSFAIQ